MRTLIICIAAIAMLAIACNSSKNENATDFKIVQDETSAKQEGKKPEPSFEGIASGNTGVVSADTTTEPSVVLQSGQPVKEDWDKKIIKTANIELELKDYKEYDNNIHKLVKNFGAYIAQEQQLQTSEQLSNSITIKVPVDQFDNLINSITADSVKVLTKNISSEDVTGEVVDTKARTEAKKDVRNTYLNLLKQARNMKEILEVQEEINSIQEDIEAGSGRVQYLTHASAYSTVNLKYFQYLTDAPVNNNEQPGFALQLLEAFKTGGAIVTKIVLFFISIWPLAIAGIVLLFYAKRWRIKKA